MKNTEDENKSRPSPQEEGNRITVSGQRIEKYPWPIQRSVGIKEGKKGAENVERIMKRKKSGIPLDSGFTVFGSRII